MVAHFEVVKKQDLPIITRDGKRNYTSDKNMKPQGNQQEEQREREQINESGGGHRTPDPGPQKQK
jgi:hypothetical protein